MRSSATQYRIFLATLSCARLLCMIMQGWRNVFALSESVFSQENSNKLHRTELVKGDVAGDATVLNVHIVAHTHDDVGWLKTVEQYYYGLNNTLQPAYVKYILDTSILALEQNPNRTFTYVEMAYFTKWWAEQNEAKRESVKKLVVDGQLSFANGGWCMHDEAATHYVGMLDQTTLGHSFLKETFNYTPRVGWQLDPFGHSATQASLLSADVGFDALFFGRIDYQDIQKRQNESRCEGLWQGSESLGSDAQVFWGLTGSYHGNYGPPIGFNFGNNDDPFVESINLDERVADFVAQLRWQSDRTSGNNVLLTMGSDFQYDNGIRQFDMLDGLISSVNQYQAAGKISMESLGRFDSLNVFYSTPEKYVLAKYQERIKWEVKTDDFFPYADCPDCYWTGYFTSRPALKRFERVASGFLHAARQIEAVIDISDFPPNELRCSPLNSLSTASGIAQHHDAVSGTSKQHVAYDYAKKLDEGMKEAFHFVSGRLKDGLGGSIDLAYCQELNVSRCEVSQSATVKNGTDIYLVAYNALSSSRQEVLAIPVSSDATYEVHGLGNLTKAMKSVLLPSLSSESAQGSAPYMLHFASGMLPPLGAKVYRIRMVANSTSVVKPMVVPCMRKDTIKKRNRRPLSKLIPTKDGKRGFLVNRSTGLLSGVFDGHAEKEVQIMQQWGYYTSYASDKEGDQNSGAYIFRPEQPNETLREINDQCESVEIFVTELLTEVHTIYSSWIKQVIRVKSDTAYLEVEYSVGPIPDHDGKGKEVVTRFDTSINSGNIFYTDSNGRDFIKRTRSYRRTWDLVEHQPVSGNYYPVNAAIFIQDDASSVSILNDRSQGGTSLTEGSLELMIHRRTKADDVRGVGEPLDETDGGMTPYPPYGNQARLGKGVVITGSYRIYLTSEPNGASIARTGMDQMFSPVHIFLGSTQKLDDPPFQHESFSALSSQLPANIMLVTFAKIHARPGTYMVRLAHQYGIGEGPLAAPVDVDISNLFNDTRKIISITEKTLSGNQDWSEWSIKKLKWESFLQQASSRSVSAGCMFSNVNTVTISPMKICTMEVKTVIDLKVNSKI